jgi:HD superfamily phosphohydrolase
VAALAEVRAKLREAAPELVGAVFGGLAPKLIPSTASAGHKGSKDFNDPIWRIMTFDGPELDVVGLPLLQRLRRIKQLGLAYLVYPSAQHSRFEHSLGAAVAATRMFEQIARDAGLMEPDYGRLLKTVRLAAIVHDCGHTVFSHVGERVLGDIYRDEFARIADTLLELFPDPLTSQGSGGAWAQVSSKPKSPPAPAELIAVLLMLSEAMQRHLERCGAIGGIPLPELIVNTVALILGKPRGLQAGTTYHYWIKSIVSGDVDADKLDYVARDAYFAGLPVSADVHRLVSQMASARFPTNQAGDDEKVEGRRVSELEQFRVLAVRPSAVSALEMLVVTRSYLFERLYAHHKTRAAERELERILRYFLLIQRQEKQWTAAQVLDFLYTAGGDDAALQEIAAHTAPEYAVDEKIRTRAQAILNRELPFRAIAIMNRASVDRGMMKGSVRPWEQVQTYFAAHRGQELQGEIAEMLGLDPYLDLIVDPPPGVPITEDPEVFVAKTGATSVPERVNKHFDAEQLSNAYRDVKRVAWVFCRQADAERVAAATAILLQRKFDFLVTHEAVHRAKVSPAGYMHWIDQLSEQVALTPLEKTNLVSTTNADYRIYASVIDMESATAELDTQEQQRRAADVLSAGFIAIGLPRAYRTSYYLGLIVLKQLIAHARTIWRSDEFADPVPYQNESRFQAHLGQHLREKFREDQGFQVHEHAAENGGYTDIVVMQKAAGTSPMTSVVIELKSAEAEYEKLVEKNAGQPNQYTEVRHGPVSILYCQFKTDGAISLADTISVRKPGTQSSTLAVMTLGTRAFSGKPSDGGNTSPAAPSKTMDPPLPT